MFTTTTWLVYIFAVTCVKNSEQGPVMFPQNRIEDEAVPHRMEPLVVDSLEDIMGEFRVQQIAISSSMLNSSRRLRLPEKMAEAQVEEAEERSAKAYRGKNEARTPFIATTSRYNLGYIGRGYDIYRGNPLSDDGVVDQGFRMPVIDLPFSFRFTADGEYRIPDNVDVISETSASFGSSFYQVKSESDYQSMLKVDASVNFGASGWGFSGSFSASTSYQKQKREIEQQETTTINVVGRATVYRARLSSSAQISKVSDYFESAIIALPTENCEEAPMQEMYIDVIKEFGTHYTTDVVMGAKAVEEFKFQNSDVDKMASEGISVMVAAQLSYSGFGFSAGGGFSVGFSKNTASRERFQNTRKERREYYIGGNPPSGESGSQGSTQNLREWARSAAEKPVPIQYKLSSIDELLMPNYFRRLTYGFYERRKCMRQAILRFCQRSINPELCNTETNVEPGLKRRKRSAERKAPIQFGDFVTLSNQGNFLVLGNNFGFATGTATKPLVVRSQITNYDGLFQIMPLEGQYEKLTTNVHTAEPFTLRTVEGDELFMGRLQVSNIDSPSEDSLMNLFDDKDDKRQIPHVGDFFIFLKKDKWAFYAITLNMYSSRGYWKTPNKTFMIKLEGDKGTAETVMDAICGSCWQINNRYAKKKFHKLFIHEDIGKLSKIQLTGMYNGVTDPIRDLYVKVTTNGKKARYVKTGLPCRGTSFIVENFATPETKSVQLDLYPVQFAFQSKTMPQNEAMVTNDVGYIELLTSIQKETYWGNPTTHLMRAENLNRIGIKEQGPMSHLPRSSDCNVVIYPDESGQLSKFYSDPEYVVVSFDVTSMVNSVEIYSEKGNADYILSYVDRNSDIFTRLNSSNLKIKTDTNSTYSYSNFTLSPGMYATAIKIATNSSNVMLNSTVDEVIINGCPSAVYETGSRDKSDLEWRIKISENEVQTYPFLSVITEGDKNNNLEEVIKNLDKPVKEKLSFSVPVPAGSNCNYDSGTILKYLQTENEMAVVKYNMITVSRDGSNVKVDLEFSSLNRREHDMAMLYLENRVKMAVESVKCGRDQINLAQTGNQTEAFSTTSVVIIAVLATLLMVGLGTVVFVVWRRKRSASKGPSALSLAENEQASRMKESFNQTYDPDNYSNRELLHGEENPIMSDVMRPATCKKL